jgi:hypothetical protein
MTKSFLVCYLKPLTPALLNQPFRSDQLVPAKKLSLVSLLQNDLHFLIARTRNFDGDTDGSLFRLCRIEGLKQTTP